MHQFDWKQSKNVKKLKKNIRKHVPVTKAHLERDQLKGRLCAKQSSIASNAILYIGPIHLISAIYVYPNIYTHCAEPKIHQRSRHIYNLTVK